MYAKHLINVLGVLQGLDSGELAKLLRSQENCSVIFQITSNKHKI